MKELKLLTREHLALKELRTDAKNRIHAKAHSFKPGKDTIKRLNQQVRLYDRQLKEIESNIQNLLKSCPETWAKIENILTVNSIGLMTIAKVLAETNAFALIRNGKQLTSYAGLDVVLKESGKPKKAGVVAIARKLLLLIYYLWTNETQYDPAYSA